MTDASPPQLAVPGAGLPALEHFIVRILFRIRRWCGSRASFLATFQRERAAIGDLVTSIPENRRGERILIARLPGLEDSSRYWSVWMTLDHLRITNEAFGRVITALVSGIVPPGQASTAAVKPDPAVTAEVEAAYGRSCDALLAAVDAAPDLKTSVRWVHPWFGPLDASGWHALAGMHMGIHRKQIAHIRRRL